MILFDLTCEKEHRFESWFRNGGAVDKLIKAKQVSCPKCGSTTVEKALSAPRIGKSSSDEAPGPARRPLSPDVAAAMEKASVAFAELREAIEKNCDNVGEKFPEEARRIHYGESKKRGIYGKATNDEAKALKDEGIEIYSIPGSRRTDS